MTRPPLDETVLEVVAADTGDRRRPLLFVNATIHTLDPLIGELTGADLLLGGDVIVGVGPGLHTADDDGAIVVDCTGPTIVPGVVDGVAVSDLRARPDARVGTLTPGNPATVAVVDAAGTGSLETLVWWPSQAAAVIVDGDIVAVNGVLHHAGYTFHRSSPTEATR